MKKQTIYKMLRYMLLVAAALLGGQSIFPAAKAMFAEGVGPDTYYEYVSESGIRYAYFPGDREIEIAVDSEGCENAGTETIMAAVYDGGRLVSCKRSVCQQGKDVTFVLPYYGTEVPVCKVFCFKGDYMPTRECLECAEVDWISKTCDFTLQGSWPKDGSEGCYPQWGYFTFAFTKELDAELLKAGTLVSACGEELTVTAQRGATSYGTYLMIIQDELKLDTEYTLTIPAGCVCSTDGDVYPREIKRSFKTASDVVFLHVPYGQTVTLKDPETGTMYQGQILGGTPSVMLTDVPGGTYDVLLDGAISLGDVTVKEKEVNSFDLRNRGFQLIGWSPTDGANGYYPQWGYLTFYFNKQLDKSRLAAGTLVSEDGKAVSVTAQRGRTSHTTYLMVLEEELELDTVYTLTIPAGSVCGADQDVFGQTIELTFKTASNVVEFHYEAYQEHLGEIVTLVGAEGQYLSTIKNGIPAVLFTNVVAGTYEVLVGNVSIGEIHVKSNTINSFVW